MQSSRLAPTACVSLAETHALLGEYDYLPVGTSLPEARTAATRALAMGARGEAYVSLAEAKLYCDWDLPGAEKEYHRAMALEPRYATTHHWYGWYLVTRGRYTEGLAALRHAHSLDPQSLIVTVDLGWALMCAEDYDRAIEHLRYAGSMDPTFFLAPYSLAVAYILQLRYEDALTELRHAERIENNAQVVAHMGFVMGALGRQAEARDRLAELRRRSKREYVSPYLISLVHAGLGEAPQALTWLTRAVQERSASLLWPGVKVIRAHIGPMPGVDRLLGDSGFPS